MIVRHLGPALFALALLVGQPPPARAQTADAVLPRIVVAGPDGRLIVFHTAARDSAVVSVLASGARTFLPAPMAGLELAPDSFSVIVAPTDRAFATLTGGRVPDWGLAVAFPEIRRLVIRSPGITGDVDVDPAVVLRHELSHLYLGAVHAAGGQAVPRWFNEGFAALYADEWRWVDPYRLAWARWTGALTPLSGLEHEISSSDGPAAAYAQSMAAVRNLRARGDDRGVGLLLGRMIRGDDFDAALRATYGLTLARFYEQWEHEMGRSFGWGVVVSDRRTLWGVLALVVAFLFVVRRYAFRRDIARGKREEDAALGKPGDHSLGAEAWERYWEHDDEDDAWRGKTGNEADDDWT